MTRAPVLPPGLQRLDDIYAAEEAYLKQRSPKIPTAQAKLTHDQDSGFIGRPSFPRRLRGVEQPIDTGDTGPYETSGYKRPGQEINRDVFAEAPDPLPKRRIRTPKPVTLSKVVKKNPYQAQKEGPRLSVRDYGVVQEFQAAIPYNPESRQGYRPGYWSGHLSAELGLGENLKYVATTRPQRIANIDKRFLAAIDALKPPQETPAEKAQQSMEGLRLALLVDDIFEES